MSFWPAPIDLIDSALSWPIRFVPNPVFVLAGGSFQSEEIVSGYRIFCQLWFIASVALLALIVSRERVHALSGFCAALALVWAIPSHEAWMLVHTLPTSILFIELARKWRSPASSVLMISGVLIWTFLSGPLAALGLCFLLPFLLRFSPNLMVLGFGAGAISSLALLPVYPMPAYPWDARLTQISKATFWGEPLVGPAIRPNTLNYSTFLLRLQLEYSASVVFAITIVVCFAISLLGVKKRRSAKEWLILTPIMLLPLYLYFDLQNDGVLTRTIGSVSYGLFLLPFPWIVSEFLLLYLACVIVVKTRASLVPGIAFAIGVLLFGSSYSMDARESFIRSSPGYFSNSVEQFFKEAGADIKNRTEFKNRSTISIKQVLASIQSDDARFALDSDLRTRWSTKKAQDGSERFEIQFKEPSRCPLLNLDLGNAVGDFPRGLAVDISENGVEYVPAVSFPNWEGPLKYGTNGLAYFGPESEVKIPIPTEKLISSIRIRQTGSDSYYFWSIAEIQCEQQ